MVKMFNKSDNPIQEVTKKFFLKIKEETINEEEHSVVAVISDASVDAHRESIALDAWQPKDLKKFLNNGGMFLSRHDNNWIAPSLKAQIGFISKVWIDKKTEQILAKFNWLVEKGSDEADWGWVLASLGTAAFSVGVRVLAYMEQEITEAEWKTYSKPFRTYLKVSLKEVSQVLFPANDNARQNAVKSTDPFLKEYGQRITNKNILDVTGAKSYADYLTAQGVTVKADLVIVDFEVEELNKAKEKGFIKKDTQELIDPNKTEEGLMLDNEVVVIEKETKNTVNKESEPDVQKKLDLILESLETIKESIKKTDARVTLLLDSSTKEEVKKTDEQEATTLLGKLLKGISTANTSILGSGSVSKPPTVEKTEA